MKNFYLFLCLLCVQSLSAQISFTNATEQLLKEDFKSGIAVGIADMNGDGRDDIVRLDEGVQLHIELQTADCAEFRSYNIDNALANNPFWNIAIGDIDNDGRNDCMMSGLNGSVRVVRQKSEMGQFDISDMPNSDFFAQGANFVDIDGDGMLDAFICDDDAVSKIYMNNGNGTFTFKDDIIDLTTAESSDNSGNYGSVWTDFDSDGDLDLYIAKCRQGVDSSTDPRRINMLFENDGQGNFIENAAKYGLATGAQTWTADFGDIDNDGDFDCFFTNHDVPSMLMENIGDSTFNDIASEANLTISGGLLQGVMADFNNDGFLDILTSGSGYELRLNNGDKTFTDVGPVFGNDEFGTFSLGDLNHDGFIDIYAAYQNGINNPSFRSDRLWLNDGNVNNWIKFDLEGRTSNANAIGAKVELFGDWGKQTREVRAGESYGISTTHIIHFGIGQATVIDSAVIYWPNGEREVMPNLTPNDQYLIIENQGCMTTSIPIGISCASICNNETVMLAAPDGYASYLWSNGTTGQTITITDEGLYHVRLEDESGCVFISESVNVDRDPAFQSTELSIEGGSSNICTGETVTIIAPNAQGVEWNTGSGQFAIDVAESGTYFATLQGACGEVKTDTVEIKVFEADIAIYEPDTIVTDEQALLVSSSDSTRWYASSTSDIPLFEGDTFVTPALTTTTNYFASTYVSATDNETFSTGQPMHTGNSFYSGPDFNGALIFDVERDMILEQITVNTEFPGKRVIMIFDADMSLVLKSDTLDIDVGATDVILNATIPAGEEYTITTDVDLNNVEFGQNNPRLHRSDDDFIYPFVVDDLVSINSSSFGESFYYYFYDWKVKAAAKICESERSVVEAFVQGSVGFDRLSLDEVVKYYPSPVSDALFMEFKNESSYDEAVVTDIQGRILIRQNISNVLEKVELDVSDLTSGIYMITLKGPDTIATGKIVK